MDEIIELCHHRIPDDVLESLEWERVTPGALIGFHITDITHIAPLFGDYLTIYTGHYSADKSKETVYIQIFSDEIAGGICFKRSFPLDKQQTREASTYGRSY